MTMKFTRAAALSGGLAVLLTPFVAPMAGATKDATKVVINEVYTFGGTKAGVYPDFVELYNPTNSPVKLDGMTLAGANTKGTPKKPIKLKGTINARGHFLVVEKADPKRPNQKLPAGVAADMEVEKLDFANSGGIAILTRKDQEVSKEDFKAGNIAGKYLDAVGISSEAKAFETSPIAGKAKSKGEDNRSYQRKDGADTDNNSKDFTFTQATPKGSGTAAVKPSSPASEPEADPQDQPTTETSETTEGVQPAKPGDIISIEEIQGTGLTSKYKDQTVTTTGVITAAYPEGGFNGAYIQTEGSGGKNHGNASSGIFVYDSKISKMKIGELVKVTGTVMEYPGPKAKQKKPVDPATQMTEIGGKNVTVEVIKKDDLKQPVPVELKQIPSGAEEREKLEGMLVKLTGTHTVTDNYSTARYGQIGLAPGDKPFYQPTELYSENDPKAKEVDAKNKADKITLDDGASRETSVRKVYANKKAGTAEHYEAPDWPASYLDVKKPVRVGAHVTFKDPMILDYRFQWNLQPRFPVQEKTGDKFKDRSWDVIELTNYERPQAPKIDGDVTVSSFNVLNYFIDLGENEHGCKFFPGIDMKGISTDYCKVRGAYSKEAFERQHTKIVEAITELDSTVVGLEEIENSAQFGKPRDTALKYLTEALNKKAGKTKWEFVPSPSAVGKKEDVIRLAYIYQKDKVAPVGDSLIFRDNKWFENWARQPLAQKWSPVVDGKKVGKQFVSVVNHFKSKGSVASSKKKGSKVPLIEGDNKTLAGNNNLLRVEQAKEMTEWVKKNFANEPVIILGDLNSYSKESPVQTIKDAGYTSVAEHAKVKNMSYQFGGVIGSLDHALVNDALLGHVTTADVWNVNALEPVAFEYARYKTTINDPVTTFDLSAYRSSDHDPIKVGLNLIDKKDKPAPGETPGQPTDPVKPTPGDTPSQPAEPSAPSEEPTQPSAPSTEKPADPTDKPSTPPTQKKADKPAQTNGTATSKPEHKGGLVLTGASVAGLAAVALTVLIAGATMVMRRREN